MAMPNQEMLLEDRCKYAMQTVVHDRSLMSAPADARDVDMVLSECASEIPRLRQALAERQAHWRDAWEVINDLSNRVEAVCRTMHIGLNIAPHELRVLRDRVRSLLDASHAPPAAKVAHDKWWCVVCGAYVEARNVTFEETHDPRAGGCGEVVRPNA